MLSPDFQDRLTLLIKKEAGEGTTINKFFNICLQEFDFEEEQRFIRWFIVGFRWTNREVLDEDIMVVMLENQLPKYTEMRQLESKDNWL